MNDYSEGLDQWDYIDDEYFDEALSKYGELIGHLLMHFSVLEHELNVAIAEMISGRTHEIGYAIMERMAMRNKIELFYKLYNMYATAMGEQKEDLEKIKNALIEINDFRNLIAHANWLTIQNNGSVRTKFISDKNTGWIKFKNIVIKPEDILAQIEAIQDLTEKIDELDYLS
jgi:hypothetical protein